MPNIILDKQDIHRVLTRIAHETWEKNRGMKNLVLIGIRRHGVSLANRLSLRLKDIAGISVPVGALDITLYRDDLSEIASQPVLKKTEISFAVKDKIIVLCDDVLYTGRTVRAALDAIIDLGRPLAIQLAVLIDRGHRELPIQATYVGKNIPTSKQESVEVFLEEEDDRDQVLIQKGEIHGTSA